MRRLVLLLVSLMSLFGGVVQAQDGCDLNAQVDALYETYSAAREEDAVGAVEALQTGLDEALANCEPAEATPEAESTTAPTAGQWRIDWASEEPTVCRDGDFTYTPRDVAFLLEVDGDQLTATDNYGWPPLVFTTETDGDYASVGTQSAEGVTLEYDYQITVISPEQIEGTVVGELPALDCTINDSFEMTLVDETVTCMVNAQTGVNLRGGPGTTFERTGVMATIDLQPVIGQAQDGEGAAWWQLTADQWVRSDLVDEAGDCENIPLAEAE